MRVPLAMWYFN
jgi:pre-rRNA-processing protein TSR3